MSKIVKFEIDKPPVELIDGGYEIEISEDDLNQMIEEECTVTDASVETNIDDGLMRIQMHGEDGLLASLVVDSAGAYEFARTILRGYDVLEGL